MISSFEFVTVLISIVLGFGITQILTGIASLIMKHHKVTFYWPHLLWVLFVLMLHVQEWWVTYELKNFTPWRLPTVLFIMLYPINLFVLARLLFPDKLKGKNKSMKDFYFKNFPKFFSILILLGILSILFNLFILDLPVVDQVLQLMLILAASLVMLMKLSNEWIHKALSVIILSALVMSIVIEWNVWLIE